MPHRVDEDLKIASGHDGCAEGCEMPLDPVETRARGGGIPERFGEPGGKRRIVAIGKRETVRTDRIDEPAAARDHRHAAAGERLERDDAPEKWSRRRT